MLHKIRYVVFIGMWAQLKMVKKMFIKIHLFKNLAKYYIETGVESLKVFNPGLKIREPTQLFSILHKKL